MPPGWRLRIEAELPSTSDLLRRLAAAGEPEGLAVLARRQTAGRGRDGRSWQSPEGNLYISLLLRPDAPAAAAPRFALLGGVALAEALSGFMADRAAIRLKWPNDLLLGGAKLAGMLCEGAAHDGRIEWIVLGLGANLAVAPQLPDRPTTCLGQHAPAPDPEAAAVALIRAVDTWQRRISAEGIRPLLDAWQQRGPQPGARLTLRTGAGETTGLYRGLDADGALLLETDGRTRRFATGELSGGGD
ncbi:biotin--[acetyl-CoA-carboxylase] ligase [Falsiroseomonas bella]|uniref:biotin--[biotin carboxyl-carrier protein] ligase n=1 Tax=Falsiroseomonas bella TaxID=2184016 RepID=A0A317F9U9_9PROT|nr:biotin--[acetyl-CoA-carboxylase] ligase [Falsiroseomonas bella]